MPLRSDRLDRFLKNFSMRYSAYFTFYREFDYSDVAWRSAFLLSEPDSRDAALEIIFTFQIVHIRVSGFRRTLFYPSIIAYHLAF